MSGASLPPRLDVRAVTGLNSLYNGSPYNLYLCNVSRGFDASACCSENSSNCEQIQTMLSLTATPTFRKHCWKSVLSETLNLSGKAHLLIICYLFTAY